MPDRARTFRSLRSRNYRLYFVGQLFSLTGTWVQTVAQGWLVLRLTDDSGFALGLVTALQFVPLLLAGPWGGVVADRFDKRSVLMATQSAMAAVAGALAVLTVAGVVELWMVYLAALLTGAATAVDSPTRQAFVVEMVGPSDLPNAIGLNSALFNAARVLGPAVAAIVIRLADVGPCFAINALSFLAVLAGLWRMRSEELVRQPHLASAKGQVRAGLAYVWGTPVLRSTLLLVAVVGTLGLNSTVVLPLLAKVSFRGDAGTYALLTSSMGLGSLAGALVTAGHSRPSRRLLVGACLAFGALLAASAAAPGLALAVPLLALTGAAGITFMTTANSTLQLASDAAMRGRVMALYLLVFLGSTPIGGPLVGLVSEYLGPRFGLGLGGVACVLVALRAATRDGGDPGEERRLRDAGLVSPTEPAAA
ncbi:MAG: MFS transporter [Actinomycetota bacterium]|nr:MFS transporter [Actinomycetota bacterium]